ncbi:uncharacterized protein PFLUO_LOCUS9352 [Penicillium psychrofluorescens]|uniref:uncharacterized protein n=1 Tax=Penicillium psychrofluorescens TaxID=3158075 RepID=UPI003CCD2DAC
MDPLTAIGLAGNIISFIDFSYKVIAGVNKVLDSSSGMTPEVAQFSALVEDLNGITQSLVSDVAARTENEKQLCILATNCHVLSGEIFQMLRSLKVGDKRSKWQGMMVKMKSMRKEKDIEAIERRLNTYQSEILIRLHVMFSQRSESQNSMVKSRLDALRNEGQSLRNETTKQLDALHQDIATLVEAMSSTPPPYKSNLAKSGPEEASLTRLGDALASFQSTTKSISQENHILSRLVFSSMYSRGDNIEDPEGGTFTWIVEEEPSLKVDQKDLSEKPDTDEEQIAAQKAMRETTRQSFLTWLNSGCHVFHISGKAGSGKSTLMKFLARSPRVQQGLERWAGGKQLIIARFFFWNSGDKLQMSLEGLYRSLLFETCTQCPNLIPRIFPGLWEGLSSGAAPPQQTPMSFEEVKAALSRLTKESHSFDGYICFWIDGLDEFEGDEVDHWHLARDLQYWTDSKHIKLCVSSRPHIPFTQTFANNMNHQICIHELTREDIRQFSLAMFEKDPNFHRVQAFYQKLVLKIVEDANGVFLWARLVVRSLLRSIGYQGTAKDLERKLKAMPKGLDELFDQILGSVDPDDRPLSDKLFLMSTPSVYHWGPPIRNAMAYSRLEDLDDSNFPENRPMRVCSEAEIDESLPRVSCLLDRFSRGLLEMTPSRKNQVDSHQYFAHDVHFLHRTVRDYILNTRRDQMQSRVPEFNDHVGIIRLLLADFKFARPSKEDLIPKSTPYTSPIRMQLELIFTALTYAEKAGKTDVISGFLEQAWQIVAGHAQPAEPFDGQDYERKGYLRGQNLEVAVANCWLTIRESEDQKPCFLCQTVVRGLYSYLSPRLLSHLKKENSVSGPNLLLVASRSDDVDLVRHLLREGRSPKEMVAMEKMFSTLANQVSGTLMTPKGPISVWLLYLYLYFNEFLSQRYSKTALVLESFLDSGADQDVEFIIRKRSHKYPDLSIDKRTANKNTESQETYLIDLLELLELIEPPNLVDIRGKLISRSPNSDRRDSFEHVCKCLMTEKKGEAPFGLLDELYVESIVTPTERLDLPFSFRMN